MGRHLARQVREFAKVHESAPLPAVAPGQKSHQRTPTREGLYRGGVGGERRIVRNPGYGRLGCRLRPAVRLIGECGG